MAAQSKSKKEGGLGRYLKNVRIELKKVIWPSREEIVKYSALVILLSVLSAVFIYIFDFIIHNIIQLLIG